MNETSHDSSSRTLGYVEYSYSKVSLSLYTRVKLGDGIEAAGKKVGTPKQATFPRDIMGREHLDVVLYYHMCMYCSPNGFARSF